VYVGIEVFVKRRVQSSVLASLFRLLSRESFQAFNVWLEGEDIDQSM
jgi:hypothetical protein